jgi:hypothetical protein
MGIDQPRDTPLRGFIIGQDPGNGKQPDESGCFR